MLELMKFVLRDKDDADIAMIAVRKYIAHVHWNTRRSAGHPV